MKFDPADPKYNHCLRKEIMALEKNVNHIIAPKPKLLTDGKAPIGTPIDLFIRYEGSTDFRDYSIHRFVDRDGSPITFYGTIKNSPLKIDDLQAGDCVKAYGRIAKYGQYQGLNQTRISHVKILENKGKKS